MKSVVRSSLALVAVVGVAVAAGCNAVRPPALSVNGQDFSRSSIDDDLATIADNPGLRDRIAETEGTIRSSGAAIWLTHLVEQQVVDQQVRRRDITVTTDDRRAAEGRASDFFGPQAFAAFPESFQVRVLEGYARREALSRTIEAPVVTDADVLAAYVTTINQLRAQCPSGRFVSHIIVPSRQQADALAAQIRSGASFEQLAREQSVDQGSAPNGGALGCLEGQQLVSQAVRSQPLDEVSSPVPAQAGWQLVMVRDTIPFELLEGPLRQQLVQQSPAAQRNLNELVAKAEVDVDPRYGRWVVRNGRGTVEPPRGARSLTAPTSPPSGATPTIPPSTRP
ncbi:MAG TPA: peptidylprolyl isomerase [Acidimicrobiia bacterium]|nr:peptidylprolyl isomerase [Acidimicrobiia bacterium]